MRYVRKGIGGSNPPVSAMKITLRFTIIALILFAQLVAGLWHITDQFIDGRYHYNWGPPFWLMNAKATNDAGLLKSYFGIARSYEAPANGQEAKIGYYASHPELIGPTFALGTRVFGYGEWSPRLFTLLLTMSATLLLFAAFYKSFGLLFASIFGALFASLPLIYIYGKMLDPVALVMLFLSVSLFGFIKTLLKEKFGLSILFVGILGMGLSDWSGLVFGGLVFVLSIYLLRHDSAALKKTALLIGGAILLSLLIYFTQIYLQGGETIVGLVKNYAGLLKYRAGIGANDQVAWLNYFWSQIYYFKDNFTLPLVLLGIIGLVLAVNAESRKRDNVVKLGTALFIFFVFLGELFYLTFLKQASLRHVYYQYYYAIPFTFGALYLLQWCTARFFSHRNSIRAFAAIGGIAVLFSGWMSYAAYTKLLFKDIWGDRSDIELIKTLKNIPLTEKIVVMDNETTLGWFSNPNINYYAGRALEGHLINSSVKPEASYYIVSIAAVESKLSQSCSKHFCLIKNGADIPLENSGAKEFNIKTINNDIYGYSFEYPAILTGGLWKLTPELEKNGVKESIVLQTPPDFPERLIIMASVEDHPDASADLESFADSYEESSRAAGMQLTRIASKKLFIDDVKVAERKYAVQKSNMPYNIVRFALRGPRLYIFSIFRADNNVFTEMERAIFDSIHFSQI